MATLTKIRNEVILKIGLDNTAAGADELLVDEWANEAVRDVLLETQCYTKPATSTTTANQNDYDLDPTILKIKEIYASQSGQYYRLREISTAELIDLRVSAGSSVDTPATHFAVEGSNLLMLYPTPSAVYTLTMYYVPRPTEMSSGAHDPSNVTYGGIPVEFHKAIKLFALAEAADYRDDQSSAQGERYRQAYEFWLRKIRKAVNGKGNTTVPAFEIRPRRSVPHDPSTDLGN
jgi:hypothetical protein